MANNDSYNLKNGRFYFGGWFSAKQWGRLKLPRERSNGLRESKLFAEPTFKTVVWVDRPAPAA